MAEYNFREIEQKWQGFWKEKGTFHAEVDPNRPKFYSLDMFPYPSGAGLHVGHPLGYIASDIVSRFKILKGFNVLHPMGYDSFGLPAEQYAIQTGQHPAITTEQNIARYTEQLKNIGFAFDWEREVRTSDPSYYKWTQWIFMQLFNSYYDLKADKALSIDSLVSQFEKEGNTRISAVCDEDTPTFSASDWAGFSEKEKQEVLLKYRLTFLAETTVNWCPALGTVLSNDEVKDGFSERGGHPVERKKMMQWSMRITAYADRLLQGLEKVDWAEPIKEMQRNWIGKSIGAEVLFQVKGSDHQIKVFTTRVDTIYGVTYLALAPESDLAAELITEDQRETAEAYIQVAKNRSERERMSDVKTISGAFTGSYAINPFNGEEIQIWVADYVLAGYGTGAVMAVPAHDERDYNFAKHFGLEIRQVIEGSMENGSFPGKGGLIINSGFISGLYMKDAMEKAIAFLEEKGIGKGKIQYRMRDAIFTRQRYWGEPLPVYFKDGLPYLIDEKDLPLVLPEVDKYLPTEDGEPPLGRAKDWTYKTADGEYPLELSTMPGWAGSSWYFFRYMDPKNDAVFADKSKTDYWGSVDLYIGGSEHATGHLLYSRFWTKFLYDLGVVSIDEPFQKMINQGMIQGRSNFVYRLKGSNTFVSHGLKDQYDTSAMHVDVNIVHNDQLNLDKFKAWRPDLADAEFILEDGKYLCGAEVEKMSKSKYNVVNPDDIIERYGADTLRLYEMFLGPLEQFKPWNTNGIDGVFKFLRKLWNLYHNGKGEFEVSDAKASKEELKTLHKTIKKMEEDMANFSFNTSVSSFMICVNELTSLKCNKREILEPLAILVSPYAPHIAEELWSLLGHVGSITEAKFPEFKEEFLVESSFEYPVMINGKMRAKINLSLDLSKEAIEKEALADETVQKWLEGKTPKKIIVVPGKIVNLVI
ncbi:MAG TPA: leucine--tRNA ligase [Algoriphagus sp.]|jgi:leucyl-tRNA synthetase|uniref:leucine--tRNA ligase n=1 Tax=unclassified Algoriphagus TaxID=2641541 RepID=UPI000C57FB7A|nr:MULTISPECIES: leucine--tRNA ligase [unclassified Algoriphagus]MAL12777.1 leucine--tRNA ligase [Algoriphagus sp.]MAN88958.1 leucine--tRNA ligase [Algoriphagus sp.]QYH39578.1 leucine--tRNA ligase [Algoriphagus sp. NBT04N3]HAD53545.1 leucine--tRNA ligase [Algoriphagus sp.]HCD86458.1 leucine--tRNA ligase [Algoriphagus sp.]|tara:strand:+ start:18580 stop:21354 length:2775 start_codon:yes stop_codon:yes gene_type:complete